jgi:hypothetical protein
MGERRAGARGTVGLPDAAQGAPADGDMARTRADLAPVGETQRPRAAVPVSAPAPLSRLLARLPGGWPAAVGGRRDDTPLTPRRLVRALSRQSRRRAMARLRALPCFSATDYVGMYDDLAATPMDPHFHALFVGGFEERRLFRPETLARSLGGPLAPAPARPATPRSAAAVALYVSSLGNIFMREIAEDIAASLGGAGVATHVLDETGPIVVRPHAIFVAPHEFFLLGRGAEWVRDSVIANGTMLNTEQPQTRWFGRALPFLLAARGVIDLCPQSAALFAASGAPSLHLTPAPPPDLVDLTDADRLHPLFRVLPAAAKGAPRTDTPFVARPLDLCFFGTESRHREDWLARNAGLLADFECVVHYRREDRGPIRSGAADGTLTRLARHVAGHAKIALNLHRDAFGYLEWHRMLRQGLATGAVVVSEPCLPHPLLTPGVHYFEENSRQIPGLLDWLLRSDDGARAAASVQAQARLLLTNVVTPCATAADVLGFLHSHAGLP